MKKQKIKQSIYRILLSEVLPYELPLIISNNRFYNIADKLRLKVVNNKVEHRSSKEYDKWADAFVLLLNGTSAMKSSFNYYINKGDGKTARELVLIHPFMQMKMLEFYKKYDSLILNFCQKSNFSIRYPYKRATFLRPKSNLTKAAEDFLNYKANTNPKNYFHYQKYQNINSFYDEKEFLRLESRFKHIYKTDIHHCFDDIPIMDLAQRLYKLGEAPLRNNNFASEFSLMMEEMNNGRIHQDTSHKKEEKLDDKSKGVLIGPEFSRIFAEMFFQQLDVDLEIKMKGGHYEYKLHSDYECFRYVDDFFLFYNDNAVYNKFEALLIDELYKHGKMQLNSSKKLLVNIPFVTGISIAKRDLKQVVNNIFEDRLNSIKGLINRESNDSYDFPLKMQAQYAIQDVKTIIEKNDVKFSDVSSFLLGILHRRLGQSLDKIDTLLNDYRTAKDNDLLDEQGWKIWGKYENDLVYFFRELIKFIFYIFNNDIRMSSSIRTVNILDMILSHCKGTLFNMGRIASESFSNDAKAKIYKSIVDKLNFVLKYNKISKLNGLEISNLMLIMKNIPVSYNISPDIWNNFIDNAFNKYQENGKTNFLVALTLLNIFGSNEVYSKIKIKICNWLIEDLNNHRWSVDGTESFMIIVNLMTSPFVGDSFKKNITTNVDRKFARALNIIRKNKSPFMQWQEFSLTKACQIKYSAEVY